MEAWKQYQEAKEIREEAEKWLALLGSPSACGGRFSLQLHWDTLSAVKMCGQHHVGGTVYWDIPIPLAQALVAAIKASWPDLSAAALARMKEKERQALLASQGEVKAMMEMVNEAAAALDADGSAGE